jgi:hypothetical protein
LITNLMLWTKDQTLQPNQGCTGHYNCPLINNYLYATIL